ncbi:serine/threonine-protein phosphatase 7 long form homolog [Carex rostrata]
MAHIKIDPALLAGLVERWRPETHSFHLPVGEMTITLQDVSCLWALPIVGLPVTGASDRTWSILVDQLLGNGTASAVLKKKKRSGPNDTQEVRVQSGYAISLKELRIRFAAMPTEEQIRQYTRAYVLDLFGSMFFADSSGDSVPAMYLQFLQDLDSPKQYNWDGAVLAYLYRSLCVAVQRKTKLMFGPNVLLQHWCWSRLPTGRPRPLNDWSPNWANPNDGYVEGLASVFVVSDRVRRNWDSHSYHYNGSVEVLDLFPAPYY